MVKTKIVTGEAWFSQPVVDVYKVWGPVPGNATEDEARKIMWAYYVENWHEAPEKWRDFVKAHMDKAGMKPKESWSTDAGEFVEWDSWSEWQPEDK